MEPSGRFEESGILVKWAALVKGKSPPKCSRQRILDTMRLKAGERSAYIDKAALQGNRDRVGAI